MEESAARRPVHVYALGVTALALFGILTVQTIAGMPEQGTPVAANEISAPDLTPAMITIEIDHERLQHRTEELNRKLERLNDLPIPPEIPRIIIHRR